MTVIAPVSVLEVAAAVTIVAAVITTMMVAITMMVAVVILVFGPHQHTRRKDREKSTQLFEKHTSVAAIHVILHKGHARPVMLDIFPTPSKLIFAPHAKLARTQPIQVWSYDNKLEKY